MKNKQKFKNRKMFQRAEITQSMFSGHSAIVLEITDKKIIFMCLEKKEYTSKGLSIPLSQRGNHFGMIWKLENIFK